MEIAGVFACPAVVEVSTSGAEVAGRLTCETVTADSGSDVLERCDKPYHSAQAKRVIKTIIPTITPMALPQRNLGAEFLSVNDSVGTAACACSKTESAVSSSALVSEDEILLSEDEAGESKSGVGVSGLRDFATGIDSSCWQRTC